MIIGTPEASLRLGNRNASISVATAPANVVVAASHHALVITILFVSNLSSAEVTSDVVSGATN